MSTKTRLQRLERLSPPALVSPLCQCSFNWEQAIGLLTGDVPFEAPCIRCGKSVAFPLTTEQESRLGRMVNILAGTEGGL